MSIFEYNSIENYIGNESSPLKDLVLSFGGVVVGFILSESATFFKRKREIERIGKAFYFEIGSIKQPLKNQVKAINELKNSLTKNENIEPSLFIFKNLEFVKTLDRHSVSEYSRNKFKKENLKRIREIYNALNVVEAELDKYVKLYENLNFKLDALYEQYSSNINEYIRSFSSFKLQPDGTNYKDNFTDSIETLFLETVLKEETKKDGIIQYKETLHKKLLELYLRNPGHAYYKISNSYNQKAFDILNNHEIEVYIFIKKLESIMNSLKRCYEKIYSEDFLQDSL